MRILIQGAGIAGLSSAIALAQDNHKVFVTERRESISTDGAGICLYWNALADLATLGVLGEILDKGAPLAGQTEWLAHDSSSLGIINYAAPKGLPAYLGINRTEFLNILMRRATSLGVEFSFGDSFEVKEEHAHQTDIAITTTKKMQFTADLFVVADGVNSAVRRVLVPTAKQQFSGFALWHSMHDRHPLVNEKITVVSPDKRLGIIPMSDSKMYIWASIESTDFPIDQMVRR